MGLLFQSSWLPLLLAATPSLLPDGLAPGGGCPNDCSGHGVCFLERCICEKPFVGADCALQSCPRDCCGNGLCLDGVCECREGFGPSGLDPLDTGSNASLPNDCCARLCPDNCGHPSGRGSCDSLTGTCTCTPGWQGEACAQPTCPANCSGHGTCDLANGGCDCVAGWGGADCAARTCPAGCSGRGVCIGGECRCAPGFTGHRCERAMCDDDCSGKGRCLSSPGPGGVPVATCVHQNRTGEVRTGDPRPPDWRCKAASAGVESESHASVGLRPATCTSWRKQSSRWLARCVTVPQHPALIPEDLRI